MKIGIIGIGMLGEAVALNLLNLGYDVSVFNRTEQKTIEIQKTALQLPVATSHPYRADVSGEADVILGWRLK